MSENNEENSAQENDLTIIINDSLPENNEKEYLKENESWVISKKSIKRDF